MILIVGGIASGKKTFAARLGYTAKTISHNPYDAAPCVDDIQNLAAMLTSYEELDALADTLAQKECLIACEVGQGIVPQDERERTAREFAGRLTNRLAQRADTVVRMVCGCPMYLKGNLKVNADTTS